MPESAALPGRDPAPGVRARRPALGGGAVAAPDAGTRPPGMDGPETPPHDEEQARGADALSPGAPALRDPLLRWKAELAAAGPPNSLLPPADAPHDWLDLTAAHPSGLAQLLAGRPTRLSSLVREPAAHAQARARVRRIRSRTGELVAERGSRCCYLAAGLATWRPGPLRVLDLDATAGPVRAPVLLRACALRPVGSSHEDYDIDLEDTAVLNPQLLRRLAADHAVRPDGDALAALAFGYDGFDPHRVFARMLEVCREVPGLRIDPVLLVGTFTAGAAALLADVEDVEPELRRHPVLGRALHAAAAEAAAAPQEAGVPGSATGGPEVGARPAAAADSTAGAGDPDPSDEILVTDLDAAQRRALRAVLAGESVTVEGPPGTGLTHVLASAAACLAAQGRNVLVVTPRRATAEAFLARLTAAGLGDIALDLHDGTGNRRAVLADLAAALAGVVDGSAAAAARAPEGFEQQLRSTVRTSRAALAAASRALHLRRRPWNVSAYEAMVALSGLMAASPAPATRVRLPLPLCERMDEHERDRARALLREAAGTGAFAMTTARTRWLDAAVHGEDDVLTALAATQRAARCLPEARRLMAGVAEGAGLAPATTVADWQDQLRLLLRVRDTLDVLLPEVYEQPLDEVVPATGEGGEFGRWERMSLRRRARQFVRPGVDVPDLHGALLRAQEERRLWPEVSTGGGLPRVPIGLAEAEDAVTAVAGALSRLDAVLPGQEQPLRSLAFADVEARLADLAADEAGLRAQPARMLALRRLAASGLGELAEDLRVRRVSDELVSAEFDLAWWASVLDSIVRSDARLARHDGAALRRAAADLRLADVAHIRDGVRRIRLAMAEHAQAVIAAHPEQYRWLSVEVSRGQRSAWPNDLFRAAPDVVAALRPIWVLSPEAVARVLPVGRPVADVVMVDDAGHVRACEAVAAVARAPQVVVAGDRLVKVAPGQPDDGGAGTSILDEVAAVTPVLRLDRDHRAVDGRMLDPVRRRYPGPWSVVEGASVAQRLRVEHVDGGVGVPGPGEEVPVSPDAEVARVVELVAEHASARPEESLMVVTLGERHADRIREALRVELPDRPELASWLEEWWRRPGREPFLVRPAPRVVGLERDDVIVSIGLGRTPHGRVLHRFGVLDTAAGPGMLLTAMTRARQRTCLVCCFTADDLDAERLRTPGALALRDLLAAVAPEPEEPEPPVDALVADLRDRLVAAGLPVRPGGGDPQWPLDLAIGDPRVPGRMLVAVDLDGPRYAERRSARERERQRRDDLERAGWTYCRVWSMDLFLDPAAEVERIRRIWREALGEQPGEAPS